MDGVYAKKGTAANDQVVSKVVGHMKQLNRSGDGKKIVRRPKLSAVKVQSQNKRTLGVSVQAWSTSRPGRGKKKESKIYGQRTTLSAWMVEWRHPKEGVGDRCALCKGEKGTWRLAEFLDLLKAKRKDQKGKGYNEVIRADHRDWPLDTSGGLCKMGGTLVNCF